MDKDEQLFCGIDGGGTSSKIVVADRRGCVLHSFQTGSFNHYGTGMDTARQVLSDIREELVRSLGAMPGIIFAGHSALDQRAPAWQVENLTQGCFYPAQVIFDSDVLVALLAFTLGRPGAILAAGTGSMACGWDPSGAYHTVGGWGQTLGDEGSAYHLALAGIKAAIYGYEGLGESTVLISRVKAFFGLEHLHDLIALVYDPHFQKKQLAAFAPHVEAAALSGDPVAWQILQQEINWLFKLGQTITLKCQTSVLGYHGGVFSNSEFIRQQVSEGLEIQHIQLMPIRLKPEIGAVIGAFREAGINVDQTILHNLQDYKN